ncbi:hypothetical protein ABLG96_16100 [Nakamurella sp. A5-74]|uniref:LigA protein n=1 Tax=Nakamurella sp. A5-74 TaxID=3158264 RepID=A0AAU8DN26_9ACTN
MTKPDPDPSSVDGTPDDEARGDVTRDDVTMDSALRKHFATAAADLTPTRQPSIASLLPARRPRGRWWAPATVAGGLIAAATATVLILSSTAPSSGPTAGVAPSGPSAGTTTSSLGTEADPAPPIITVGTQQYRRGGPVPWYRAMRSGNTVAVTTGPEMRGACDIYLYRLTVTVRDDDLVLTSYRYDPVGAVAPTMCAGIALPPYVAAVPTDLDLPQSVVDGSAPTGRHQALTTVLIPHGLPDGLVAQPPSSYFPQVADPARPLFPAAPGYESPASRDSPIGQSYSGGGQRLAITQGLESLPKKGPRALVATIGRYQAVLQGNNSPGERCLGWKDDRAGNTLMCGVLSGGDDALIAMARSIYNSRSTDPFNSGAAPSTPSGTPSAGAEPAQRITVSGRDFVLIGAVPWYSAIRIGNTVAVTTGAKVRGACDTDLYRLTATTRAGRLILTSYHYLPVSTPEPTACVDIGLSPFVATLELDSTPPATAEDGARAGSRSTPFPILLKPRVLPQGFVEGNGNQAFPQILDPERPVFPPFAELEDGTVVQTFSAGSAVLTVRQGLMRSAPRADGPGSTTVGSHPATLVTSKNGVQHCVRWADATAGGAEVCGNVPADTVLAVARSIYR